jgi:hypothetical protein
MEQSNQSNVCSHDSNCQATPENPCFCSCHTGRKSEPTTERLKAMYEQGKFDGEMERLYPESEPVAIKNPCPHGLMKSYCGDCVREYKRAWKAKHRERLLPSNREYKKRYLHDFPDSPMRLLKENVRTQVYKAIKSGRLVRGSCEVAGCEITTEAHHNDYSKPFEVRWLCKQHHEDVHHKEKNNV